jgi:hypothetical protein
VANDTTANPFALDTVNVADILNGRSIYIKTVRWTSPGAIAGHRAILTNAAGRIIWESVANGANYVEVDHLEPREEWQGLKIPTLDSGRILLYIL